MRAAGESRLAVIRMAAAHKYLQAYPSFPIEILSEIACFVAGANDYGTLASLCATSRLMSQELKRVLYETVIFNDALLERLSVYQPDEDCSDENDDEGSSDEFDGPEELLYIRWVYYFLLDHPFIDSAWQIYHHRCSKLALGPYLEQPQLTECPSYYDPGTRPSQEVPCRCHAPTIHNRTVDTGRYIISHRIIYPSIPAGLGLCRRGENSKTRFRDYHGRPVRRRVVYLWQPR